MEKAVIYARYSSNSQDPQTIEVQLNECYKYAGKRNIEVVGEYVDEGKTGRNDKRSDFKRMLADSKTNAFDYVIVYKIDRFARSMQVSVKAQAELSKNNVTVLSTVEEFGDSASGKLMKGVFELLAEYYSNDYSERISRSMDYQAKQFKSLGSNYPFGYKSVDKKIVIDEELVPYVKIIFEMYASGSRFVDIYNYLNSLGIKTKRGGSFNKASLGRILRNKTYIGYYVYKGEKTPGVLPRIIEDSLFYKVQERLAQAKKTSAHTKAKEEYILSGKLYCKYCNQKMIGHGGTSKTKRLYKYYKCKCAVNQCKCSKNLSITKETVEDVVFKSLKDFINESVINCIVPLVLKASKEVENASDLRFLKKALDNNSRRKNNLLDSIAETDDSIIRVSLYDKLRELEDERVMFNRKLTELEKKNNVLTERQVRSYILSIKNKNDIANKKKLVNSFVDKVVVGEKNLLIDLKIADTSIEVPIDNNNSFFKGGGSYLSSLPPPI